MHIRLIQLDLNMIRNIVSVVVGYAVWTVIFLGGSAAIRNFRAEFHDENGFTSDVVSLVSYLVFSIVASVAAGFLCVKIASSGKWLCATVLAICLLATGIPVQLSAWNDLPVWYNLVFLVMLVPVTLLGGNLAMESKPLSEQRNSGG
jgi:uncharacterized membrane protein (DUF485 family)